MEKDVILQVEGLSKQYRLGVIGTGTISHDLNRWWHKIRGKEDPYQKIGEKNERTKVGNSQYVWALRDVSFEVKKGEVLGIIGKNGAGKSTLLKLLSKVTTPTKGVIRSKGRIASLLEVGTGFHPELTGKENIFLNGAILGMTKAEIKSKFEEIVDFAGVQRYVNTPVKRYSSGMKVRLAFAVAAYLEPEILVVDEVLAVGDAEFQKKAIGKMKDISSGDGRTVLFVSHNMSAVKRLCTRAVIIEDGQIIANGDSEEVVNEYLKRDLTDQLQTRWDDDSNKINIGDDVKMISAQISSENGFAISEDVEIAFEYELYKDMKAFNLSMVLQSFDSLPIFNSISKVQNMEKGRYKSIVKIPKNLLNDNLYKIRILLVNNSKALIDLSDVIVWESKELENRTMNWYGKVTGHVRPKLGWEFIKLS